MVTVACTYCGKKGVKVTPVFGKLVSHKDPATGKKCQRGSGSPALGSIAP